MLTHQEKVAKLKEWLAHTVLDTSVLKQTIGVTASSITPEVLLKASAKLIKVNKREVPPDDRDSLKFSTFHGIEDFIKEHIEKDSGKLQRKATQKIQQKKSLNWLTPSYFTPQIRSVIIGNSLANNVEGINPLEHFDNSHRVTKLGMGGIASIEAVPDESRDVNPSSLGFYDPLHTIEGEAIGVTSYLTHNVVKGKDLKLYRTMKKPRSNETSWVDHETILNSKVAIPAV